MLPIIYFLKYLVRSGIRTHAYAYKRLSRLRPERHSALDHSANAAPPQPPCQELLFIFTYRMSYFNLVSQKSDYSHVAYYILPKIFSQKRDSNPRLQL